MIARPSLQICNKSASARELGTRDTLRHCRLGILYSSVLTFLHYWSLNIPCSLRVWGFLSTCISTCSFSYTPEKHLTFARATSVALWQCGTAPILRSFIVFLSTIGGNKARVVISVLPLSGKKWHYHSSYIPRPQDGNSDSRGCFHTDN